MTQVEQKAVEFARERLDSTTEPDCSCAECMLSRALLALAERCERLEAAITFCSGSCGHSFRALAALDAGKGE